MKITVNGKVETLEDEVTVFELLRVLKVEMPDYVTVQVNDDLVLQPDFETTVLRDGDQVDFLYYMGGGER